MRERRVGGRVSAVVAVFLLAAGMAVAVQTGSTGAAAVEVVSSHGPVGNNAPTGPIGP